MEHSIYFFHNISKTSTHKYDDDFFLSKTQENCVSMYYEDDEKQSFLQRRGATSTHATY